MKSKNPIEKAPVKKKAVLVRPKAGRESFWPDSMRDGLKQELITEKELNECLKAGGMREDLIAQVQERADRTKVSFAVFTWYLIRVNLGLAWPGLD